MATHACPVRGCRTFTLNNHLMCRPHWFMLSSASRARVWRTYHGLDNTARRLAILEAVRDVNARLRTEAN